jgi:hypothetical protein
MVNIKLGSKMGTVLVLDRGFCLAVADINFGSKLGTVLEANIKLACAKVRAVTKNIVNSFGAEIGSVTYLVPNWVPYLE